MSDFELAYKRYGEQAILIEWPAKIDKKILNDVILFKNKIVDSGIKDVVDVINTYNSITVVYCVSINFVYDKILALKLLYRQGNLNKLVKNYRWEIPVCYDKVFGVDLGDLQSENDLTYNEIIELHSTSIYTVYFVGFLPGFLYLGGLVKKLHIPRKSNPRLRVEKGSVAIGGGQTGIYPSTSAGGWHVIGNTPVSFFNINSEELCFANPSDEIKFIPVDISEYNQIKMEVAIGNYQLKKTEL